MTRWLLIVAACGVIAAGFSTAQAEQPKPDTEKVMDTGAFAADLYAKLAEKPGNLFFSPASIETALGMTFAGAKGNTADQMAKVLHYDAPADKVSAAFAKLLKTLNNPPDARNLLDDSGKPVKKPAYQLVVANALWGQDGYPFKPDFTDLVQKSYGAGLNAVDFAQTEKARTTINDWVATQTKDKIKDLIPKGAVTPATRLVLTNAIYFKSNWAEKFSKSATKDGAFKLSAEKSVDVPLMHQTHAFDYFENDDLQMLDLPYTQGELSMVIVLPKKVDGLAAVEKALTSENVGKWLREKKGERVEVALPKFTFSAELMLGSTLKAMGMTDAFDPDKADFSGMTTKDKLSISGVIHKAFVAVDEEGTEAAAATAVIMPGGVAFRPPVEPKVFNADHPFAFLIRHRSTGEVLFVGRLVNPKGE